MKLVVFDIDGTLIDSQQQIHRAMTAAFGGAGLVPPPAEAVLQVVGLTLHLGVARLAPDQPPAVQDRIVADYRAAFNAARAAGDLAPLYPGAADCLDRLAARGDLVLGLATGKPRRGLDHAVAAYGWAGRFATTQSADEHPSKPDPSMLRAAMAETGIGAGATAMVGDTGFDMDMARAAGVAGFGVGWGYHPPAVLRDAGAVLVARDFADLTQAIGKWADG